MYECVLLLLLDMRALVRSPIPRCANLAFQGDATCVFHRNQNSREIMTHTVVPYPDDEKRTLLLSVLEWQMAFEGNCCCRVSGLLLHYFPTTLYRLVSMKMLHFEFRP